MFYNESMIEDQFFIKWHGRKARTDKESDLYDHKAEKVMRGLLDEFVQWLQSDAEYDEEVDYGEEEKKDDDDQVAAPQETEEQKQQRLLIEAQKKAQQELLSKAKGAAASEGGSASAAAASTKDDASVASIDKKTNVAAIEVDDDFDLDDI